MISIVAVSLLLLAFFSGGDFSTRERWHRPVSLAIIAGVLGGSLGTWLQSSEPLYAVVVGVAVGSLPGIAFNNNMARFAGMLIGATAPRLEFLSIPASHFFMFCSVCIATEIITHIVMMARMQRRVP